MNRRLALMRLVGVPTVAAFPAPNETPQRALAGVAPFCPVCGMAAMFMRRSRYPLDQVPVTCANVQCGWTGVSPTAL
jgi:hypothetical protein